MNKWTNISPIISRTIIKIKLSGLNLVLHRGDILGQKIKQDESGNIGKNIRRNRKERGMGQTELVRILDLEDVSVTRECLVKIESGKQHIQVQQLKAIKEALGTTYDELLE